MMKSPREFREIYTLRMCLRSLMPRDCDDLFRIYSSPRAMRYWTFPPLEEPAEAERLVERAHQGFEEGTRYEWALVQGVGARVIGTLALFSIDATNRRAEIGFILAEDVWAQGYMHEAASAAITFAFSELELHRVEADVDPRNKASLRLLERLGFVREGLLRERWIVDGEVQDSVMLGVLRSEWYHR